MWIAPVLRPRTEPLLIQVQVWAARMAFFDPDLSVVAGRRAFFPDTCFNFQTLVGFAKASCRTFNTTSNSVVCENLT